MSLDHEPAPLCWAHAILQARHWRRVAMVRGVEARDALAWGNAGQERYAQLRRNLALARWHRCMRIARQLRAAAERAELLSAVHSICDALGVA